MKYIRFTVLLLCLIILSGCENNNEKENTDSIEVHTDDEETSLYAYYQIQTMVLSDSLIVDGVAVCDEEQAVQRVVLPDNAELLIAPFTDFDEGTPLYQIGDDVFGAEFRGRLLSVEDTKEGCVISTLNYELVYVECQVPVQYLSKITTETGATISTFDDSFKGAVASMGYTVNDGYVSLSLSHKRNLLPGTTASVNLAVKNSEEGFYIPDYAVTQIGDSFYCDVQNEEGKVERRYIELGAYIVNDGSGYYKILSGLAEGETVCITIGTNYSIESRLDDIDE